MPLFITQGRFTTQAVRGMMATPENREEALRELIEASGGTLRGYYFTFGEYDFLTISEGSVEGMASGLIVGAATGAVTDLRTSLAMSAHEMQDAFSAASKVTERFKPAGAPRGSAL
ncbi:GYD domain-containing protein [Methylobacterium oxalidis]|uniref:GYD domain-containing protein n=1 Tax=Methylobacterium oxalidis TaxID=944322 RepID=A0A512IX89_9HYPH|nr:GYD domain-containing protein [Methylobacterium oxalidis]GEP02334.1 hypothetical protein MOX02_03720 [Methylobacterium oxalidis]GJE31159.1 hypothetical protein LDDCCGHA_1335 [Methylobacterium oxalidis]GLS67713.1 hypothetical protein GCM10007888_60980 [Methylobacterium oxalidis]